jgi:tetratricopeptide (TPR) repeat protein
MFTPRASRDPLPGYIADTGKIEEEYLTLTGKPLDPAAEGQFDRATESMRQGNYGNAAIVLEAAARDIPVPAVFNDLGVLYAKLKDGRRAIRAFRDALARDHDYAPVRANLKNMNMADSIDPGANELEPNNDNSQANAVWLDRPVQAAIAPSVGDVDCFWFTTPRPPRDRITVAAINQSATLIPRLRIYDERGNLVTGLKEATSPGASVRFDFSPPPNTLYYVQVDGVSGSSGAYTLAVSALKAYDVYEPNDTILTATRIALGQTIDANIMDGDDTDFYSFLSPVAASVNVDVVSHSDTLLLGLGTFAPDLHSTGFAPDPKAPGESIHYAMQMEANQLYYVQVFSKNDTTGPYTLVVK